MTNEPGTAAQSGENVGARRPSTGAVVCLTLGFLSVVLFFAFLPTGHFIDPHSSKALRRFAVAFVCTSIASGMAAALLGTWVLRGTGQQARLRDSSMARSGRALGIVGIILGVLMVYATTGWFEAKLRERIARDTASLRTIATALEQYAVDRNVYPPALVCLTRTFPEALLVATPFPTDEARRAAEEEARRVHRPTQYVTYLNPIPRSQFGERSEPRYWCPDSRSFNWLIWTPGPDGTYDIAAGDEWERALEELRSSKQERPGAWLTYRTYDATNGTVSAGDLVWWHR
jgi:type II secretory pathway pseudopilin PulG